MLVVPSLFVYIAGNIQKHENTITLFYEASKNSKPSTDRVKNLLAEINRLEVKKWTGSEANILSDMEKQGADILLRWDKKKWLFYIRSVSHEEQQLLTRMAYNIQGSLAADRPWQLDALFRIENKKENIVSKIHSFHPTVTKNDISLVPKIMGLIVVFVPFLFACSSFVREKESRTLEILLVSPYATWATIYFGKLLTPLFIGFVNYCLFLLFSETWYGLQIKTGFFAITGVQLLAMLSAALLGLAVSSLVKTQLQAYFVSAIFLICSILLTGFIYPVDRAINLVQISSYAFPLTFSMEPLSTWLLQGTSPENHIDAIYTLALQSLCYVLLAWYGLMRVKRTI